MVERKKEVKEVDLDSKKTAKKKLISKVPSKILKKIKKIDKLKASYSRDLNLNII